MGIKALQQEQLPNMKDMKEMSASNASGAFSVLNAIPIESPSDGSVAPSGYATMESILNKINAKNTGDQTALTKEEMGYFNLDGDKDVDEKDILALLDTNSDGKLDKTEAAKFSNMDIVSKRSDGYDILKDIKGVTDLATTSQANKKAFKDFFDVDNDSDIDMLDVLSMFDANDNGVIDGTEKTAYDNWIKKQGDTKKLDATDLGTSAGKGFKKIAVTGLAADSAQNEQKISDALSKFKYNVDNADIETLFGGADKKISDTELQKIMMLDGTAGLSAKDFEALDKITVDKKITKDEVTKALPAPASVTTAQSRSSRGRVLGSGETLDLRGAVTINNPR